MNESTPNTPAPNKSSFADVTSAELSHICDAARLPQHPQHQDACNAVASYMWDTFMHGDDTEALRALYTVTAKFNDKQGGLNG